MRICFLLFLAMPLFALKLITYQINDEDKNALNITLSFDGAYNGKIEPKRNNESVWISLNGVTYFKKEQRDLASDLITRILILPEQNKTTIELKVKSDVDISSKPINDNTGFMIRALPKGAVAEIKQQDLQVKGSNFEGFDYTNYIIVIVVLFLLLIVLWWFNRQVMRRGKFESRDLRIIFQRPLDRHNQFIILEYGSKRFVMIIGNSNIVLDTIEIQAEQSIKAPKKPAQKKEEKSFENFFEENKQRLQRLIQGDKDKPL